MRLLGYAVVSSIWIVLLGMLGVFGAVYLVYSDIKSPAQSHRVTGTGLEVPTALLYQWRFRPIWQAEPSCAQYDPQLSYVPKPGVARFRAQEFDTLITMTAAGLRQQPPPGENVRGAPVILLGDSYTMGWGVNDDQTFSALLQQRHGYRTINTGVSSYGTARELLRLRRLGLLTDEAVLVVQFCENDDGENLAFLRDPAGVQAPARTQEVWQEVRRHQASEVSYGAVLAATVGYFREKIRVEGLRATLRQLRRERLPPIGVPVRIRDRRPAAEMAATFLRVWDSFPELAGKKVIVTELNPNLGETGFLRALQEQTRDRPSFKIVPLRIRAEEIYRFDQHLTPQGHATVAEQLDQTLREITGRSP